MSRGLALMMSVLIVGPLLLVAVPSALAGDDTPVIAGAWSGSGPAGTTATTTLDGDRRGRRVQLREEPRRRRRRAADDVDIPDAPPRRPGPSTSAGRSRACTRGSRSRSG